MSSQDKIYLAWIVLAGLPGLYIIDFVLKCLFGTKRSRKYRKVKKRGFSALKALSWQEFEHFCAEYFTRQGYRVKMMGLGGADGGMDLLLKKNGKTTLVQCKHWKQRVGVTTVREMYGVMHAHNFDAVFIVALNGFTKDATGWVGSKPIKLISGPTLMKSL
ncbi:restriction endonuclease [Pseudomonas aeruginosa]